MNQVFGGVVMPMRFAVAPDQLLAELRLARSIPPWTADRAMMGHAYAVDAVMLLIVPARFSLVQRQCVRAQLSSPTPGAPLTSTPHHLHVWSACRSTHSINPAPPEAAGGDRTMPRGIVARG